MDRFDIFPKTYDDFKERTLGGAAVSVACGLLALLLFGAEFAQYRAVETLDRLDVDTRTASDAKLPVNVDIVLPSLACSEIVTDVTDESGTQQLAVTDTLHKLRIDRFGVPIDTPEPVDWGHAVAPAFHQRKVVSLMDDAHTQLIETLSHLDHEEEENPALSAEEHEVHKAELTQRAALLQGRLSQLTAVAEQAEERQDDDARHEEELALTSKEVDELHEEISRSKLYSEEQRHHVLTNLHAMSRNLDRLQGLEVDDQKTAGNLREALRIRLSILQDNVAGFVSAADIDRRDKYALVEEILADVLNATGAMGGGSSAGAHLNASVAALRSDLDELMAGAAGPKRKAAEEKLRTHLAMLGADMRGEDAMVEGYCGSCYGASPDPTACCNSCDDVRAAYRQRKWGFPGEANFEQCRREGQRRANRREEGEGCNVYGTMQVARVTGSFHIAPASRAKAGPGRLGALLAPPTLAPSEVGHFNVTHEIRRLSFGTDFPGQTNPLDAVWTHSPGGAAIARYFLKVVPTTYEFLGGRTVDTNQFSVTQYFKPIDAAAEHFVPPTITFTFELTPIRVRKTERRGGSLLGFFTRCAALIGGLFTVAGIVDSALYHSSREIVKMREGRQD